MEPHDISDKISFPTSKYLVDQLIKHTHTQFSLLGNKHVLSLVDKLYHM